MSLVDTIRQRITKAMKERDELTRNILRLVLGEIQTAEAREGSITEETVVKIIRKLIASNEETLSMTKNPQAAEKLRQENVILKELLPHLWSVDDIVKFLNADAAAAESVKSAGNDGQATGAAMKFLKTASAPINGKDVSQAVKIIRG
ncbi:MAG TPA: GatB/YqeY domain-containing protein [Phycisphaerae bacterium]|nr:GatB/YqeY domain-containing protein [Phycisphaerae bacterium]HPS52903.1 GatB/YqeY domain-containing protein [Phycisphaerae bacterium]